MDKRKAPWRLSRGPNRFRAFFRYYLVDSSTGVKSQTMLAECKWIPGV